MGVILPLQYIEQCAKKKGNDVPFLKKKVMLSTRPFFTIPKIFGQLC